MPNVQPHQTNALRKVVALLIAGTVLFLLAYNVFAQTTNKVYACVTNGCTLVSDPFPDPVGATGTQPNSCRFYVRLNGGPETVLATTATVPGTQVTPTALPGQTACWLNFKFAAGSWSVTATALRNGVESGRSNIVTFDSAAGAPGVAPVIGVKPGTPTL